MGESTYFKLDELGHYWYKKLVVKCNISEAPIMNIILTEHEAVELVKSGKIHQLEKRRYAVEVRKFNPDTSEHYAYCVLDLTVGELVVYASWLKDNTPVMPETEEKVNNDSSIWYKYYESNNALKQQSTEPIMPNTNTNTNNDATAQEQGHFAKHKDTYIKGAKTFGWMTLGAMIGIGAKVALDRRNSSADEVTALPESGGSGE